METIRLVVLTAVGLGLILMVLHYILWLWATKGGVFTALIKTLKYGIVYFITGIPMCAAIWYWLWITHVEAISYITVLVGVGLTGVAQGMGSYLSRQEHPLEIIRDSEEEEEMLDKQYELGIFFIIICIGAGIYFHYFA